MANKFKIELELTGLKLKVEGSREDVPLMAQAVGQQMSGLLMPASNIVEGEIVDDTNLSPSTSESASKSTKKRSKRSKRQAPSATKSNTHSQEGFSDWVHDPSKWGSPKQEWNTVDKAIWLLYIAEMEKGVKELSASAITERFNVGFRQAGTIRSSRTSRDLGTAKGKAPAWVGENTTQKPSTWFLTQEGVKHAEALIVQALGRVAET